MATKLAAGLKKRSNPQYLSISGPPYGGLLDAFIFVQGSQDFTFDYYFNLGSVTAINGSGSYGVGPCYPINGTECYALREPLINAGETQDPASTPEPATCELVSSALIVVAFKCRSLRSRSAL